MNIGLQMLSVIEPGESFESYRPGSHKQNVLSNETQKMTGWGSLDFWSAPLRPTVRVHVTPLLYATLVDAPDSMRERLAST